MAELTEKGLARLEDLRNFFPERRYYSSLLMRTKQLLQEIEKDPDFLVVQGSVLRPDWDRLERQGLMVDTTPESAIVVEGIERPLREVVEEPIKVTRPEEKPNKPTCPDHPKGTVTRASLSGTDRSVWVCLVCGKRLGDAGPRQEPIRESFTL